VNLAKTNNAFSINLRSAKTISTEWYLLKAQLAAGNPLPDKVASIETWDRNIVRAPRKST